MKAILQRYETVLKQHIAAPAEENLFAANSLGRDCVPAGIVLGELVGRHFSILHADPGLISDETLPASQEILLEATLGMNVAGGCQTVESVLGSLYDETMQQFFALREAKKQLAGYSRDLERKVEEKVGELRLYHDHLAQMVEERTSALTIANLALAKEIAERKQSEQFAREILESMGEGLAVVGCDFIIRMANPAFARQVGLPLEEVVGRPCYEATHGLDLPCPDAPARCPVLATCADGEPRVVCHRHLSRGNRAVEAEIKTYPMSGRGGNCGSTLMIVNDVTEQKKLAEQLRQAQKMEAIGTLAGGIAHDFNNILTAIIGFTELARLELESGRRIGRDLQEVLKAAHRAKDLVRQILTFSRQGGREKRPVNLAPEVKEVAKMLRATLPSTIAIRQHVADDGMIVQADPTQIHQVLMNLCTNAAQAMDRTGGVIDIGLKPLEIVAGQPGGVPGLGPGTYLLLQVKDTGPGMSPEVMGRIFDPYFTTKKPGEGTGLGLAVVHGIVEDHGGLVTVDSAPGQGAAFSVYLPAIRREVAVETASKTSLPSGRGERILFVDDEDSITTVVERMLGRLQYDIVVTNDSEAALACFLEDPDRFDLVITDMVMPKLTGDRLAAAILATRPDLPVMLCSASEEMADEEKARAAGFCYFLRKPLDIDTLSRAVRLILDGGKAAPAPVGS